MLRTVRAAVATIVAGSAVEAIVMVCAPVAVPSGIVTVRVSVPDELATP
jgi:hypothetical protein